MSLASSGRAWWLAGLLVLAAAAHAAAAAPDWASIGAAPYEPPKTAPAFTLPDLTGKPVTLADQRGKITLLFFWATW
jgi:cytochrome oxidase Cu insertion factor (SCO1/SenC/PrrC family)